MREHRSGSEDTDQSSSSFLVIGDGRGGDDDDDRPGARRQHFVRTLDSKLRKLQLRQRAGGGGGGSRGVKQHASRKPVFVTTVKTGIFLDPPPDLAALLGLDDRSSSAAAGYDSDRYYSYSSKPRAMYDRQNQRTATTTRKTEPHSE